MVSQVVYDHRFNDGSGFAVVNYECDVGVKFGSLYHPVFHCVQLFYFNLYWNKEGVCGVKI